MVRMRQQISITEDRQHGLYHLPWFICGLTVAYAIIGLICSLWMSLLFHNVFQLARPTTGILPKIMPDWGFAALFGGGLLAFALVTGVYAIGRALMFVQAETKMNSFRLRVLHCALAGVPDPAAEKGQPYNLNQLSYANLINLGGEYVRSYMAEHHFHFASGLWRMIIDLLFMFTLDWRLGLLFCTAGIAIALRGCISAVG